MEKYKVLANREQLENLGISYNITNLIGYLKRKFKTNYYEIEITHMVGKYSFTNSFDIPNYLLEKINN